ncbi:MAG TPA: hypothetical protein VGR95_08915 [Thermoanaerobaculia bacterium]|nr:hypothetical protein [Thermoanaerobaculia bacterium]
MLLDDASRSDALSDAASELHDLLCNGSEPPARGSGTLLPSGLAISPADAASCAKDARRTAVFLRGIRDAIREARRRFPGRRLNVVYAGTGPLATLVIPLLPFLSPDAVRFSFIDIHAEAIASVEEIVRRFGFDDFILGTHVTDATTYRSAHSVHVAIVETMQRALTVEPQVAVMRNLASQLVPGGLLVPQRIVLTVGIADPAALPASPIVPVGTIDDFRNEATFRLPVLPSRYRAVCIAEIDVFGPHRLRAFESGLTYPEVFWDLAADGQRATFFYEEAVRPGLRWRLTSPPESGR